MKKKTHEEYVKELAIKNPDIEVIFVSAKTGEGIKELSDWIVKETIKWNR